MERDDSPVERGADQEMKDRKGSNAIDFPTRSEEYTEEST